jgi:hypothetical protein
MLTKYDGEANTISAKNSAEPHIRWVRGLKRLGREGEYSPKLETDHSPNQKLTIHIHLVQNLHHFSPYVLQGEVLNWVLKFERF